MRHVGNRSHVKDDVVGAEALSHFESLERLAISPGAFGRMVGGVLIRVRRIDHDLGGRGEVIVNTDAIKSSGIESPLNAGDFRHGHAVGELHGVETQLEDFVDHVLAVGVAGVVPAG